MNNVRSQKAVLSPSSDLNEEGTVDYDLGHAATFQSEEGAREGEEIREMFDRHRPKVRPKRSCVQSTPQVVDDDVEEDGVDRRRQKENGTKDDDDDDDEYMEEKDRKDQEKSRRSLDRCRKQIDRQLKRERIERQKEARKAEKKKKDEDKLNLAKLRKNQEQFDRMNRLFKQEQQSEAKKQKKFDSAKKSASAKRMASVKRFAREEKKRMRFDTPRRPDARLRRSRAHWTLHETVPRRRSDSEPRDLNRSRELEPKMSVAPVIHKSKYADMMRETVDKMSKNMPITVKFFEMASNLADADRRKFTNFADPFAKAHEYRAVYVKDMYNWRSLPADHMLDLDPKDKLENFKSWKNHKELPSIMNEENFMRNKFPEIRFLSENFNFKSLWDLDIPICEPAEADHDLLELKVSHMTRSFNMIIQLWKRKWPEQKLPRVVHYFLFLTENKEYEEIDVTNVLIRDIMFWLPIHLGDVRESIHAPREEILELAKQLARTLLIDWPLLSERVPSDEMNFLYRLEAATMRMEVSLSNYEVWLECHPEEVAKKTLIERTPMFLPTVEKEHRKILKRSNSVLF